MDYDKLKKTELLQEIMKDCHETAKKNGWWDEERPFAEHIANIHGEVTEAWEWYRKEQPLCDPIQSDHIPGYYGIEEEFADTIIRILDTSAALGYYVIGAIFAKMEYNKTRSYRHGNKKA